MDFSNPLTYTLLFASGILILLGIIQYFFPPKKINNWFGYRSPNSKKNQEQWDFAQCHSAKGMLTTGGFLGLVALVIAWTSPAIDVPAYYSTIALILLLIVMMFRTEGAIKENFPES